jgi:hypothetical protein
MLTLTASIVSNVEKMTSTTTAAAAAVVLL